MHRTLLAALGLFVVVVYAGGSGYLVSRSPGWYASLVQPPWQPPDAVFGLIWPYNFLALGVAAWVVPGQASRGTALAWVVTFAVSVVAALTWGYAFYVQHALGWAAVALGSAAVLTWGLVVQTWAVSTPIGLALLPYGLWVTVATSLSVGYAALNR